MKAACVTEQLSRLTKYSYHTTKGSISTKTPWLCSRFSIKQFTFFTSIQKVPLSKCGRLVGTVSTMTTSCCLQQSGDRRYLYHQGNKQTTGGALRAAARPWFIPAGKYIPADRPQRSTPPRRGTPPQLVREVAALYGGVAVLFGWSVSHGGSSGGLCGLYRGQIYGSSSCDFSQSQYWQPKITCIRLDSGSRESLHLPFTGV